MTPRASRRAESEDLFGAGRERAVERMFDRAARRYDLLNRLLTFGLDRRWRRRSVRLLNLPAAQPALVADLARGTGTASPADGRRPAQPAIVADLACGTGDFCGELQRAGHRAVGLDFSTGMLSHARVSVPLVRADVLSLPLGDAAVDGAVCGFALRNLANLETFLAEVARVVRPGGRIALLEVSEPTCRVLRWGHRLYFGRVVPIIGGLLSDRAAYRYLPDSMSLLPSPEDLTAMLTAAGLADHEHHVHSGGIAQTHTATRRQ